MNQENNEKRQSQLSKGGFPFVQKQGSSLAELQARNSKRQADYLKGEGQQQKINYNNNHNHNDQSNYNSYSHGAYEQNNGEILALGTQKNPLITDIQYEQELKQLMNKIANSARTDIPQKVNPILSNSSYYIEQILAEKEQLRIDNISLFEIIQQQNQKIQQLVNISNQLQHQQSKQLHHYHPQVQISPQSLSPQSTAADNQCSQSNGRYESCSKLSGNSNVLRYPTKNDCNQQSQQKTNEIDSLSCTFRKEQLFQGSQPQQDIKNDQNNNFGKYMSQPNNQNSNNKSIFKQFEQQIQNIKEYDILQQQQSQETINNNHNNNLQISNDNNQYDNMDNNDNLDSQELNSNLMVLQLQEQIQSLQQSLRESLIEKNQLREKVQALEQQSEMYTTLKRDYQELIGLVQQLGEEWADYEEQKQCIIFKQEEEEQQQQEIHQLKTINPKQTTQVCMNCLSMLKQHNLIIEELKQRIKHNEYNSTQEKVKLNEQINMLQIQNKKLLDSQ